jgi:hypothetical protein
VALLVLLDAEGEPLTVAAVIYNCKRCKIGRRVDYPNRSDTYRGAWWREGIPIGGDQASRLYPGAALAYRGTDGTCRYDGDPAGMCDQCGRPMAWGYLQGHTRADVRCNAVCTHARGHSCDCSCGGANHGAGW